jgi:tRNA G18 (ribose-2'-O)-methylase SpoU
LIPFERVSTLDDPRIAVYRSLKLTNQTRGLDQFVVEGEKLVSRLLTSRFPTVSILATDRFVHRLADNLPEHVAVYVVPLEQIHSLVGFPFHRGVLACGRRVAWPSCQEIVLLACGRRVAWPSCQEIVHSAGTKLTLVFCPKLSNPENLGAIARIADVFAIDAIVAGPSCPDPFSRRVLRVSMGSVLRLPVLIADDPLDLADLIRRELDVEFWAAVASPQARPFDAIARPSRLALVLGDEDQGVSDEWIERTLQSVTIPMRPGASSLNVAVAAGILLQHLTRPDVSA